MVFLPKKKMRHFSKDKNFLEKYLWKTKLEKSLSMFKILDLYDLFRTSLLLYFMTIVSFIVKNKYKQYNKITS